MCGIAGIVYFDRLRKVSEDLLKPMTDSMIHRGPDDEGFHCYRNVGLGFRRLSIIDLNHGHQPLSNQEKSLWIVFNGEIYNYLELRAILQKKGYHFLTASDTEVIINLYAEYGDDCVNHLRGMFSFVIHDNRNNKILCARDRFGIKPFFYYLDHEKFVFGSEIKAILKCQDINMTLSQDGIESYFTYGYITSDLSAYELIKKLPAANTLSLYPGEVNHPSFKTYWTLPVEQDFIKTKSQWKEEILSCLEDSVQRHMISDVPLGAFLSGGIDSSTVVATMSKFSNQPVKTFSIGFKEQKFNELAFAREISEKYHTEHHELIVEPESIDLLPLLVKSYDEPFADSSAIPTYYVSKFAREYVTVALSGDGGDELFAGYSSYQKMLNITRRNPFSDSICKSALGGLGKIWPEKLAGKGLLYYLFQEKELIGAYYNLWKIEERKLLFSKALKRNISIRGEDFKCDLLRKSQATDFITKLCQLDVQTYMTDDILTKVDRVSMQNSLEVRVPLLDHKFVELAFSIPAELKLHERDSKYILKYAVKNLLTPNVLHHPKQGFAIPLSQWFKRDLKVYMQDILSDKKQPLYNFIEYSYVLKQLNNHISGMRDMSSKIWSLLFFNEWLKQIDG